MALAGEASSGMSGAPWAQTVYPLLSSLVNVDSKGDGHKVRGIAQIPGDRGAPSSSIHLSPV